MNGKLDSKNGRASLNGLCNEDMILRQFCTEIFTHAQNAPPFGSTNHSNYFCGFCSYSIQS